MHTHSRRLTAALVSCFALLALAARLAHSAADTTAPLKIEPFSSPAGKNSSEPQFGVQGDRVTLSWVEVNGERAALKFAERTPTGWSSAQTVASGTNFFINSFDVPSVHALADGTLAAHWEERLGSDEDSDASKVMLSWSKDQGRTWSRAVSPHHDGTETEHGFVSLFQAPGAGLGLVWIDGRATNPKTETGDMSLRASVYDAAGKQIERNGGGAAGVRMLFDFRDGNGGWEDCGLPKPQRHGSSRHLCDALRRRQMERAGHRSCRRLDDRCVPDQRPIDRRERPRRGRGLVHGQERPGPRLPRVFTRCRAHVRRSGSRRRHQLAGPAWGAIAGRWIGRGHVDRKDRPEFAIAHADH